MDLAPYAVRPETSRGRLYPEAGGDTRSPFQRDRDRIIHATSFRRLQYKTQVFVYHEGDHFRTRLTHSIEVAQIARSIARLLHLDEDIAEALALAHDLGHPPFGHAGEDALNSAMKPYGGFDHNAQSLKVVTQLEARYAGFDGLNLPSPYIAEYDAIHPLELATHASAEAQIAALADDIAYNNHDLDDGLRARLFTLEEVGALPLIGDALAEARGMSPDMPDDRVAPEMIRRVINMMVIDVVSEARRRLIAHAPATVDDVRRAREPMIAFLFTRMYRHWRVNRTMAKSKRVVQVMFSLFHGGPQMLPPAWRLRAGEAGSSRCALVVCDYIAGMTDRFALEEHRRMTDPDVPG